MRALDRLRQLRTEPQEGGSVSFVSVLNQESERIEPRARARGQVQDENALPNLLKKNDTRSGTPPGSGAHLETRTDKTDRTPRWPELPPLPDDDEPGGLTCWHCRRPVRARELVDIGRGVLLHHACGRVVRVQMTVRSRSKE